jgi:succinate dehydrogenase / fumarate reductase membrane anchor subunit
MMFLLMPFIIWMFDTSVSSEISFAKFKAAFNSGLGFVPGWFFKLVALALIWAYLHHFCAGLRHLWMDVSHKAVSKEFGKVSPPSPRWCLSIGLTVVLGAKLFGLYLTGSGATTMSVNYGSKRIVVGAHYGLRDWLSQRVTAGLMALFTLVVLAQVIFSKGPIGYDKWAGIFASQWMKVLTFTVIVALLWHVWVGMRDIWMDYIKPVGLRLVLQIFTIVWLSGCAGWAIQVLWRL